VTWPPPELDAGVDDGELRPDDELPDEFDVLDPLLEELELLELLELLEPVELEPELPVLDLAWCVVAADDPVDVWDAADAAPGRLTATTPAAARLAAAAETVATRSRLRPRSRSSIPGDAPRDGMLCLLIRVSLAARFPAAL
jgi:hypothetical protein